MQFLKRLFKREPLPTYSYPSKIRQAPTEAQWYDDPLNVQRLREIINDPVFVAACGLTVDANRLRKSDIYSNPQLLAFRAAYDAGLSDAFEKLELYAQYPNERPRVAIEEWGYIQP